MAMVKTYSLRCDVCHVESCTLWRASPPHSSNAAVKARSRAAKQLGWRRRDGQDLCPTHAAPFRRAG
jgi:hypothetical protein